MLKQLSLLDLAPQPEPEALQLPPCHQCHAAGCEVPISLSLLMCGKHWRMVPKDLQRQVWAHYRSGQEEDKQPSDGWLKAARAAINHVFELEQPVSPPVLEPPVIEPPLPKASGFLIGDQVTITDQIQGRGRAFTPWQNRTGIYCGLNPVGLALVDFGIPGLLYPCPIANLSHE